MFTTKSLVKKIVLSAFLAGCLTALSSIAGAGTYYVSPGGSAAWTACTNSNTLCAVSTAMANAQAGDTVYFRGGTYDSGNSCTSCDRENFTMKPANSGTAGNPITFMAYPGETPVILGINCGCPSFGTYGVGYIVWDGFSGTLIDKAGGENRFVMFDVSNNITIRNCNLKGVVKKDYHNNALIESLGSSYVTIENNKLHDNNGDPSVVANTTAILFWNTVNAIVRNNDIYNNSIGVYDKRDGIANAFYNNHIWGGSGTKYCNIGFQIDANSTVGHDDAFCFNVVRNCNIGAFNEDGSSATNPDGTPVEMYSNLKIYNNVFYAGMGGSAGIHINAQTTNAEIYNNIIVNYQNGLRYSTGPYLSTSPTASTTNHSDYNMFYPSSTEWNLDWGTIYSPLSAWTAATTFDAHSSVTDPLFANPKGVYPTDYRPTAGSPAYTGGAGGSYPAYQGVYSSNTATPSVGLNPGVVRMAAPRNIR